MILVRFKGEWCEKAIDSIVTIIKMNLEEYWEISGKIKGKEGSWKV